ncbi:Annexin [Choiromyces venosus 120613-1]|uniref:Annexin n=1 Tax=Choiromyces venosus 120613-1 TaxID=1336337 RepID=A0A3N4JI25_9PEZI|nr:Annexin [Choiromyces venosus 120613-1]
MSYPQGYNYGAPPGAPQPNYYAPPGPGQPYPPNPQSYPPPGAPSPYAGQPPYQQPQGYPPPGQSQQYYQHPPPQQGYPPQPSYNQPQYAPQGQYPPPGAHNPQYPPQNAYQHPPPHGQPGMPYGAPPPHHGPPPQQYVAPINATADVDAIYRACKGFGTDERALINVLGCRDAPTIDAIRAQYTTRIGRDLIETLEKETSGNFETALVSTALGPIESEAYFAHRAIVGVGTKESMLTEAIMGKSNQQIATLKTVYQRKYGETLEAAVRSDLSGKTEQMFVMALAGNKLEEWVPVDPHIVSNEVRALRAATQGRIGTDQIQVCSILTRANDAYIRAYANDYKRQYAQDFVNMIRKEFSGHMEAALLYIVKGAINKAERDAELLEDSMAGLGTKDELLISRLVRAHWDKGHFARVKAAYSSLYKKDLTKRVRGETSGDYGKMMVALAT